MLYGMDEEEKNIYPQAIDEQLNMKKVAIVSIIVVTIVVLIAAFFVSKFIVSNISKEPTKEEIEEKAATLAEFENKEDYPSVATNEVDNTTAVKFIDLNLSTVDESLLEENNEDYQTIYQDKIKDLYYYTGTHMQIASHDFSNVNMELLPKFNENAQEDIRNIYYNDEKVVYLTFDDGPTKNITPQILDILKEENVPATFFVLGQNVKRYPDLIRREYNEGHYLANHGYSHEYSKIYASADTVFQEYNETEQALREVLGMDNFNTFLFRFPGGASGGRYSRIKEEARELLTNYGIAYTNWNALTGDAEGSKTVEDCMRELEESMEDDIGVIVLMHDAADKEQTVKALPEVIKYFRDRGYEFKNFYEIFK